MNSNKNNNTMIFYGTLYIGLIFLFGFIYFWIGKGNFKLPTDEDYNFITFMYFSSVTMTTLGYGDILPITSLSRGLASLQTILGVVVIGFFLNSVASKQAKDLEKQEEKRKLPIRIAIYNDIRLLILRMTSIWIEAYNTSVPGKELESIEELLSKETFDKIRILLDLRSEAPIAPKRSWTDYLENNRNEVFERGNRILDRYGIFLDYNIYGIVNNLINESTIFSTLNMIRVISAVDKQEGYKRIPTLANYCPEPSQDDYEKIKELIEWCNNEYKRLSKEKINLFKLNINIKGTNKKKEIPDCMYKHR